MTAPATNKIIGILLTSVIGVGQFFLYRACGDLKDISKTVTILELNDSIQNTALHEITITLKNINEKLFTNNIFTREEVSKLQRSIQSTERLCSKWRHSLELKINGKR